MGKKSRRTGPAIAADSPVRLPKHLPTVSIVIPTKLSRGVIATLQALDAQDYPGRFEVIVVGDHYDPGLELARRLTVKYQLRLFGVKVRTPGRDANAKRAFGIEKAHGDILALLDADVLPPKTWLSTIVSLLCYRAKAVGGPVKGVGAGFIDRYIDENSFGSKTPRMDPAYWVDVLSTSKRKLPITANFACWRHVAEEVGPPDVRFTNSYEDYSWFSDMVAAGHAIYCTPLLMAPREHRNSLGGLVREYRRSGRGCADFICTRFASGFAKKRFMELLLIPFVAAAMATGIWLYPDAGLYAVLLVLCDMLRQAVRLRRIGAILYRPLTLVLALSFLRGAYEGLVRSVFVRRGRSKILSEREIPADGLTPRAWPFVSVVVPVKHRPATIGGLIKSLQGQNYPGGFELILVGDVRDATWETVKKYAADPRIHVVEAAITAEGRDANAKRNIGLARASGEVLVLTDSDMVLPSDWLMRGVELMREHLYHVVAGSMVSMEEDFWGSYTDLNPFGSKTPRMDPPYVLNRENCGKGRHKPPITASLFFSRAVLEATGGLDPDFLTPYEDYPFADVIVSKGYEIFCTHRLAAYHYHRDGLRSSCKEYLRAGEGCADYVRAYGWSPLATKRRRQLPFMLALYALAVVALVVWPVVVLGSGLALMTGLGIVAWCKTRLARAVLFPYITALLGTMFTVGMLWGRIKRTLRKPARTVVRAHHEISLAPITEEGHHVH